jgi:acyl-CoA thioesterase-1
MNLRWIVLAAVAVVLACFLLKGCARKVPVTSGNLVFLGDSITAGYGLDPTEAYPALIKIPGMTAVNLGVSGSRSDDGLQRLRDYLNKEDAPSLVVIALGANDFLHNVPHDETAANLESAIRECKNRGIPVMLCGIRIPEKFGTDSMYGKVVSDTHVPFLPDILDGMQFDDKYLQDDGHPNADGQKLIAAKMQAAILESFSFRAH